MMQVEESPDVRRWWMQETDQEVARGCCDSFALGMHPHTPFPDTFICICELAGTLCQHWHRPAQGSSSVWPSWNNAIANWTDATFICVIGSELVQKHVGEGARMVRELFEMARSKKVCIIFLDEVDAIGGAHFDDGAGGDNEIQCTMLELINQLDGFDPRGKIKVLMATNRFVGTVLLLIH